MPVQFYSLFLLLFGLLSQFFDDFDSAGDVSPLPNCRLEAPEARLESEGMISSCFILLTN